MFGFLAALFQPVISFIGSLFGGGAATSAAAGSAAAASAAGTTFATGGAFAGAGLAGGASTGLLGAGAAGAGLGAGLIGAGMKGLATGAIGAGASAIGAGMANGVAQKIEGIPTPSRTMSGAEQGQAQLDFMNTAYPGTNAWERLGGGQGVGTVQSAALTANAQASYQAREMINANMMQSKELAMRYMVAHEQNKVAAIGAGSPYGVQGSRAALNLLNDSNATEYDTPTKVNRAEVPSKVFHNYASGSPLTTLLGMAAMGNDPNGPVHAWDPNDAMSKNSMGSRDHIVKNDSRIMSDRIARSYKQVTPYSIRY